MKKKTVLLLLSAVFFVCLFAISACARFNVIQYYSVDLSFSDSTAHCTVFVEAAEEDAEITAIIKLQKKGLLGIYTTKEKWTDVTAIGELDFYETCSSVSSGEYRLTADIDVVGQAGHDSISEMVSAKIQ